MRYHCDACGRLVKDKFLFGLWHVCVTAEERALRSERMLRWNAAQCGPDALMRHNLRELEQQIRDLKVSMRDHTQGYE